MQRLSEGLGIHWCIKQIIWGRGRSPGEVCWKNCCLLSHVVNSLLRNPSATKSDDMEMFFNLPTKIRGWMQLKSEKKCPVASSKCLTLHMNACLVWASWLCSEVFMQSGFTHCCLWDVFHQCPVCSHLLSLCLARVLSLSSLHITLSASVFLISLILIGVFLFCFFCFLPILMPELLYRAHSSLIDLHTHSLVSLFVCSLSSWVEATLDNSDLPFPRVFFWHVQDRK